MARALASVGAAAAAAAGFGPPRLVVLGLVLATVWAISLTVFLCGHGHSSDKKIGVDPREEKKKNKSRSRRLRKLSRGRVQLRRHHPAAATMTMTMTVMSDDILHNSFSRQDAIWPFFFENLRELRYVI